MLTRNTSPRSPQPHLVVAAAGQWFERDGERTMLQTRAPLRRLLLALAELKVHSPDVVLDVGGAFAAGWQGERATPKAAAMRVYTAVHSLRRLGLQGILVRRCRGYTLDASVELERAPTVSVFPTSLADADDDLAPHSESA